ncbi:hypothetical protein, partial [Corynebacterium tuscaniense]|uniref:hypothetical protein n=1 Tax=Corynebacterium tuscaniense TaxID=302449 RepID=UPI003615DB33
VAAPFDEEKRQQQKTSNQSCDQPDDTIPSMVQTASTSTHPKKEHTATQTNQTKNHWHTIEFSHNTRTLKHTPQTGPVQSSLLKLTHTHTTNQIAVRGSSERNHQRSFSYRHLTKPVTIRPPSGALSVTLTHIKLHTPNQQHKSPGYLMFFNGSFEHVLG